MTALLMVALELMSDTPLPVPSVGRIQRISYFPTRLVQPRHVDIWLPTTYDGKKKHSVIYMHDGQMLFDSAITWNKQEWMADEVLQNLIDTGKVPPAIIVGIWNTGETRRSEYFPTKALVGLDEPLAKRFIREALSGEARADKYLKFLSTELKPYIDANFAVKKDPANTTIMGSSMGGLISMYAFCEYPKVFGRAGCLSTHWPGGSADSALDLSQSIQSYLTRSVGKPTKARRIYFDYGDQTLDALYSPLQKRADLLMQDKGWGASNWVTKFFPGDDHSEKSWSRRLNIPLQFLLSPNLPREGS